MRPPLQKYKSLSGECRRGRTLAGPSRSFCHSGATLIRLASLGTFPLEGGRLAGDRKGRPYGFTKVHLSNRRAGEGTRPYGGNQTGSVGSAEPGAKVEPQQRQFSTYPGPSGPAGIQTSHSDFARRKFCATLLVRVPRNGVRGKATISTKCSSGAVPGGVLVNLSRTPGEAQRSGFAGKRRSKGAVAVFAVRRKRRQADFATTSRRGQSHSPPAGGESPPAYNEPNPKSAPSSVWPNGQPPSPQGEGFWGARPSSVPRGRLKSETPLAKKKPPPVISPGLST